jgi:beta-galactosidase GanA
MRPNAKLAGTTPTTSAKFTMQIDATLPGRVCSPCGNRLRLGGFVKIDLPRIVVGAAIFCWAILGLQAAELPHIRMESGTGQLVVDGQPFLILGGELGNSSAGTAAEADTIVPRLALMRVNTILMPVAWEQVEPKEGRFDFTILDHWIETARRNHMRMVLLWFGSWKNAFSNYAPAWVKSDPKRFPRAQSADGKPLEILSTLSAENRRCDSRAFAALMRHVRETDSQQQTVLMVQVENEVGYLGPERDRSAEADRLFRGPVPEELTRALATRRLQLSPELSTHFREQGRTWSEVFGEAANEVFMAWSYASYVEAVAHAGKNEYAVPMYVNAQLPAPQERAGEYPSGGPHPYYLEIWRAAAPSIDFYSPDIYWPNFEHWVQRYQIPGNPIFIPEARMESASYNALYAYGQARAFGFSPFAIDSLTLPRDDDSKPAIMQIYELLDSMRDLLPPAQAAGFTRGLVLHTSSPRPTQTVALGGYLFEATLSRSWPARTILADDGAMLILQTTPGEVYIVGSGLTVSFARDPDVDAGFAGIESIEQVTRASGQWTTERRLNGDQTNQGRQLLMDPHQPHFYRVRLYSLNREQ